MRRRRARDNASTTPPTPPPGHIEDTPHRTRDTRRSWASRYRRASLRRQPLLIGAEENGTQSLDQRLPDKSSIAASLVA